MRNLLGASYVLHMAWIMAGARPQNATPLTTPPPLPDRANAWWRALAPPAHLGTMRCAAAPVVAVQPAQCHGAVVEGAQRATAITAAVHVHARVFQIRWCT